MNLTNVHIITIDQTEEYFKQALQTLKRLNPPPGTKVTFGGQKGAFISQANFGDLDWSNATDPASIEVTLTYDYAILEF